MKTCKPILFLIFAALLFNACKKDTARLSNLPTSLASSPNDFVCEDTSHNWSPIPDEPDFGFKYVPTSGSQYIWRVLYDPIDKDVIYYLTLEPLNTNFLWRYNIKTTEKVLLDKGVLNNMDINKNGWIAYEKSDLNIYKIKVNGDSITKLCNDGGGWPKWTEDGKFLYYLSSSSNNVYKINVKGEKVDTIKNINSFAYPKMNFVYYVKVTGPNQHSIIQQDLITHQERVILSTGGASNLSGEDIYDFYTNEDNTTLYWYGSRGLSKTDINSLQTTKLIYSGYFSRNYFLHYRRSPITKRFIAIQFNTDVIDQTTLKLTANIEEFSEEGTCRRKVTVPN